MFDTCRVFFFLRSSMFDRCRVFFFFEIADVLTGVGFFFKGKVFVP